MSTMKSKRRPEPGADPDGPQPPQEVVDRLAGLLPEGALEDAVRGLRPEELSGPGGLLSQLAGRVVEAALEAELTDHLGHPPGGTPSGSNVRNGATAKRLQTDLGPVDIKTPRDRDGSFEPKLVAKRQTRLAGLDDKVLGLYAGGMTVRDISSHLSELYGTEIGRDTISTITDAVLEDVQAWRTRPLEAVYPIVYFDAMMVRVREDRSVQNRACYLALGVTCDGDREVLGIWWQDTEGAKFWLAVLNDLRRRGVADVLIACVDGLKGFPEAIEATFPKAWVQTCIVHLIRASLRYVNYRDKKRVATALRPIYTAANGDAALHELAAFEAEWGARYPAAAAAWRASWEHVTPFLSLPEDLRRAVYTTNTIEGLHRQVRKAIKTRGHFPDEQSATKLIYLALIKADAKWQRNRAWTAARAALKIHFGDRFPG
jgi:putative transposase